MPVQGEVGAGVTIQGAAAAIPPVLSDQSATQGAAVAVVRGLHQGLAALGDDQCCPITSPQCSFCRAQLGFCIVQGLLWARRVLMEPKLPFATAVVESPAL